MSEDQFIYLSCTKFMIDIHHRRCWKGKVFPLAAKEREIEREKTLLMGGLALSHLLALLCRCCGLFLGQTGRGFLKGCHHHPRDLIIMTISMLHHIAMGATTITIKPPPPPTLELEE
jgi:hypothetical protein